jgi:type I restriction enzyme R subunit
MPAPEATAREQIDRALTESGWAVIEIADTNLGASLGVAIREFPLLARLRERGRSKRDKERS